MATYAACLVHASWAGLEPGCHSVRAFYRFSLAASAKCCPPAAAVAARLQRPTPKSHKVGASETS